MPDASILEDNATATAHLEALVGRLSDAQLRQDLGEGWTVSIALAHLGFWDRRAAYVLERWAKDGTPFSEMDDDVVNVALRDEWAAIEPRVAAGLALTAAKSVDGTVARLPDAIAALAVSHGVEWLMRRASHRREHIEQIEAAIGG